MKIKKYTGISLASIFAKVKSDLGEKAIILSTKKIKDSKSIGLSKIEVTAALTPPVFEKDVLSSKTINEKACRRFLDSVKEKMVKQTEILEDNKLMKSEEESNISLKAEVIEIKELLKDIYLSNTQSMPPLLKSTKKLLETCNIDERCIMKILSQVGNKRSNGLPHKERVENIIEGMIIAEPFSMDVEIGNIFVFLGTTGVGKTTTLAKIASQTHLQFNHPVAFVTLDSFRIGAHETLKQYAKILEAPFHAVSVNEDLRDVVNDLRKDHVVFIDTSGFSQYNKLKIKKLYSRIKNLSGAKKILLLNCSTHQSEYKKTINNFCEAIDINGLILTKIDEVDKPGQILSINNYTKLPIHFLTDGQIVPDNIRTAKTSELTRKILYGKLS
ncbi:MAG: flagellar biosynthesis protein FlhF [Candidatus Aureabacteria bacterium]|nr:flagellar biosynthesis protein FlhF [Candidatus Auribacterota bacterium]